MEIRSVMCGKCFYRWNALKPKGTPVNMCQCSKCGQQGYTLDISVMVQSIIQ